MFPSICCRLCINICNGHRNLYDEEGRHNEVYDLVVKHFSPSLINMEYGKTLTKICMACWEHLIDFETFQQSVVLAQKIHRINEDTGSNKESDNVFEELERNTNLESLQVSHINDEEDQQEQEDLAIKTEDPEIYESSQTIEHREEDRKLSSVEYNKDPGEIFASSSPKNSDKKIVSTQSDDESYIISKIKSENDEVGDPKCHELPKKKSSSLKRHLKEALRDNQAMEEYLNNSALTSLREATPYLKEPAQITMDSDSTVINIEGTKDIPTSSKKASHQNKLLEAKGHSLQVQELSLPRSLSLKQHLKEALRDNQAIEESKTHNLRKDGNQNPRKQIVQSSRTVDPIFANIDDTKDSEIIDSSSASKSSPLKMSSDKMMITTSTHKEIKSKNLRLHAADIHNREFKEMPRTRSLSLKRHLEEALRDNISGKETLNNSSSQSQHEIHKEKEEQELFPIINADSELTKDTEVDDSTNQNELYINTDIKLENEKLIEEECYDPTESKILSLNQHLKEVLTESLVVKEAPNTTSSGLDQEDKANKSPYFIKEIKSERPLLSDTEEFPSTSHAIKSEINIDLEASPANSSADESSTEINFSQKSSTFLDNDLLQAMDFEGNSSSENENGPEQIKKSKPSKTRNPKKKLPRSIEEYDDFIAEWRPNLMCSVCQENFFKYSYLSKHFAEQHPSEEFYISCCQRKLKHRFEIREHIYYHDEKRQFKCHICLLSFSKNSVLEDHHFQKHVEKLKKAPYKCEKCGAGFWLEARHELHLKNKCNHFCDECGKTYKTLKLLITHYKHIHLPEKRPDAANYQCTICDKFFPSKFRLREHMGAHTGHRPYSCPVCPKAFKYTTDYGAHLKKLHPDIWEKEQKAKAEQRKNRTAKYKCPHCEKAFTKSMDLRDHTTVHTGKKLVSCPNCGKKYPNETLEVHIKRMHSHGYIMKTN